MTFGRPAALTVKSVQPAMALKPKTVVGVPWFTIRKFRDIGVDPACTAPKSTFVGLRVSCPAPTGATRAKDVRRNAHHHHRLDRAYRDDMSGDSRSIARGADPEVGQGDVG